MKRYSVYHDMELYRRGRIDMSEEKFRNIRSCCQGRGMISLSAMRKK